MQQTVPIPRGGLQKEAYERLKEMIILQELKPGELLSEVNLSRFLDIGRTPVRVALQKLAFEDLVTILPQRGVLVSEINVEKHLKLLEVRAELERLVVRAAVRRATSAQREQMRHLARQLVGTAEADDSHLFMAVLRQVHELTNEAADNEILGSVISLIHGLSRRFWFAHHRRFANLFDAAQLHARRLQAIADGDEEKAIRVCDELVEYLENFTLATIRYGTSHVGQPSDR